MLEQLARGIGFYVNSYKTVFMCFNQDGAISSLDGRTLTLGDKFIYFGNSILSTESDVSIFIGKIWTVIDRLLTIWKADLSDEIKCEFIWAVAM